MITANQGAVLKAAAILADARDALVNSRSLICFTQDDRQKLATAQELIDCVFAKLIPNVKRGD